MQEKLLLTLDRYIAGYGISRAYKRNNNQLSKVDTSHLSVTFSSSYISRMQQAR
jgi:hypothetical protein